LRPDVRQGLLSRGFEDQPRDFVGMGDQREMAGLHLDGLGAHALGHEALEIGIDRSVFRGDGIEARLRPPGRMRGLACEQSFLERLLDRIEDLRLRFRQVAREIAQERGFGETPFIAVEDDPGGGGWRRKRLGQGRIILARIRRPRRHIDKGRHVRMYTGLCYDHAGKGMSDQNRRTILARQHALGRSYRFRQRRQGVLHRRGVEPRCLQSCNHLGPG
jgi:hypothetical protein